MRKPWAERRGKGGKSRPLARRFTYRYAFAGVLLAIVTLWVLWSSTTTLEAIEEANRELEAVSEQAVRTQTITELAVQLVDEPDSSGSGRLLDLLDQEVNELRDVTLGLTEGKGDSGLPAPDSELQEFWSDPDGSLADDLRDFHYQANALTGLVEGHTEEATTARDILTDYADPVDGSVGRGMQEAIGVYSARVDDLVDAQQTANQWYLVIYVAIAGFTIFVLLQPMGRSIQLETTALAEAERVQRENNERQTFRNQLNQALEVTDTEEEILERVATAMSEILPEDPGEVLLADAPGSHLRLAGVHPIAGAPGCPVDTPQGCAAIRRGTTVTYATSRALNICPKLTQHEVNPCSAVCVPVTFMGRALGVLHVTGADLEPPDGRAIEHLNVAANEAANRLGTLRATRQTELRASTDGLTGLPNRSTLEQEALDLLQDERSFAVAIADLDHFKDLNDTYGHEAGDRALRLFAKTLRSNLRPDDIASRYGGEEFVLLLPDTEIEEARRALDRLRVTLAGDIAAAGSVPFTASWGITTTDVGETWEEIIHAADEAMYAAKRAGRNRVVVGGAEAVGTAALQTWATDVDLTDDTVEVASESKPSVVQTCPECEARNPTGTRYCLTCGTDFTDIGSR